MFAIEACPLPAHALLASYRAAGAFTDCYATDTRASVTHAQFVRAFYTTPVFRTERLILAWALGRPSTDAEAGELAEGRTGTFSAWRVESRSDNQLLMSDIQGRTRSWLMTSAAAPGRGKRTRLFFGSAVLPVANPATGRPELGSGFRALLGFHKVYSEVLLAAARYRLENAAP